MKKDDAEFVLSVLKEQLKNYQDRLSYLAEQCEIVHGNIKSCKEHIERVDPSFRLYGYSKKRERLQQAIIKILTENPHGLSKIQIYRLLPQYIDDVFTSSQIYREVARMSEEFLLDIKNERFSGGQLSCCTLSSVGIK